MSWADAVELADRRREELGVCVACGNEHADDDDCIFTCECEAEVPMAETAVGVDCGRGSRACLDCTRAWVGQIYYYDTETGGES